MTVNPTDLPGRPLFDRTIPVPLPEPLPAVILVDRDGNEWRPTGRTADGVLLLACEAPIDPEDQGSGPSAAWSVESVTKWFGPLVEKAGLLAEQRHQLLDPPVPPLACAGPGAVADVAVAA